MADRLDVAGRLDEGRPAVEHTDSYVRACELVGYQHLEIRDCYDSQDGLDLYALDADCAQLRAAAAAVTEAVRIQRAQVAELAGAWTGPGAEAAAEFLQRHCDAGNAVATEIRAAAQRCESLRDNLWHLVDAKVATAIAIDDRTLPQRPVWMAAVAAITTGVGDRPAAEELVREQINPYVDNDIRDEWRTAMQSTSAGVAASYDMVTDRLAAAPRAYFEIPGDLGPSAPPSCSITTSAPTARAAVAPAAFPGLPADPAPPTAAPAPSAPAPTSGPSLPLAQPISDFGTALGDASGMSAGAGGLGGGEGLGGLGQLASRIVQAMGSALGSAAEQLPDASALGDHEPDKAEEPEQLEETEQPEPGEQARDVVEATTPPAAAPAPIVEQPPPAGPPATAPPVTAPPVNGPPSGGSTPCEIAADELPKAGQ